MTRLAPAIAMVLVIAGRRIVVRCPCCGSRHEHAGSSNPIVGRAERFAPVCGLTCTPDQRAADYTFTLTAEHI